MNRSILLLLFVLICSTFFGQNQDFYFDFLTVEDGLSSNHILCITQDNDGFMWIATADGLNRFDGFNIKQYRPNQQDKNSISDINVNCLSVDSKGDLWIGLNNSINKYIPKKDLFIDYSESVEEALGQGFVRINDVHFDNEERLWVRCDQELCIFDQQTEKLKIINIDSIFNTENVEIYRIYNEDSCIILTSSIGLLSIDYSNSEYKFIEPFKPFLELKGKQVSLYQKTDKYIFTCLPEEVIYKNTLTKQIKTINLSFVYEDIFLSEKDIIYEDHKGNIWITTKGGLVFFQSYSEEFYVYKNDNLNPNSLSDNDLTYIFQDNSGVLWIGTLTKGINKINLRKKNFRTYQHHSGNSVSGNQIYGFYEDRRSNIWIATKYSGINIFNPKTESFINIKSGPNHPDSLSGYFFSCFLEDKNGYMWSGSWDGGLNKINPNSLKVVRHYLENNDDESRIFNSSVLSIHQDKENDKLIWVGTIHGLEEFYPDKTLWKNYNDFIDGEKKIHNVQVWSIIEFNGYLWLGTAVGLLKYTKGTNKVKQYSKNSESYSISSNAIKCMYLSGKEYLWIGTEGGGLNRFDVANEVFKSYSLKDGIKSSVVWGILEDDNGNLWISTNNGLSKFDTENEIFTNYFKSDGLQGNKFNMLSSLKSKSGEMYFGGSQGFNVFFPDSIKSSNLSHKVIITDLRVFNKSIQIGEERHGNIILNKAVFKTENILLSYKDNVFSIEFSGLNFAFPERISYKYKMLGFDKDWITTDQNSRLATYTNLPHGDYSFLVKASDENGLWPNDPTVLNIEIKPPFWKTTWAYIVYSLILLSTLYLLRKSVLRRERIMSEIKMEKIKNKTAEEVNQAKLRFYTNISHEFRTPLTLINGPVDKLIEKGKEMKWESIKNQLNVISKNSQKLMNLVNQVLDFRKVESDNYKIKTTQEDIIEFVQDIAISFNDLYEEKNTKVLFNTNIKSYVTFFDKDIIQKVLTNLISNAIKYNKEEGLVWVELMVFKESENEGNVRIVVRDEGVGIDQKDFDNIFQRYYRVDGEAYSLAEGSGIGLALSKKLIEIHKGKIEVESEKGEGSSFIIVIPVKNEEDRIKDTITEKIITEEKQPVEEVIQDDIDEDDDISSSVKELLIVEDNKDLREYIVAEFSEYKIFEAENGVQGLELAFEKVPDLIISDIMMPEMNGNDMCKKIKSDLRTSHIPIVLLTAKSAEEQVIEGLETGADDYIVKPFSAPILVKRVKNLIDNREKLKQRFSNNTIKELPSEISLNSLDQKFLDNVLSIVEENIANTDLNVNMLAENLNMSRVQLYRKMQAITDQKPVEFIRLIRLQKAAKMLKQNIGTVSEIAYKVGFSDPAYFSRCFSKEYNVTPGNYA